MRRTPVRVYGHHRPCTLRPSQGTERGTRPESCSAGHILVMSNRDVGKGRVVSLQPPPHLGVVLRNLCACRAARQLVPVQDILR